MENLSMIDVNKPEKVQSALNELIAYKNSAGEIAAVTADSIGLGDVDNTSDVDKPVSTAQKTYIDNADSVLQGLIETNASEISSLQTQVETNKTNIEALTEGVDLSALQTEVDSLKEGSGASLGLTLDEDYILTIDLKNSEGTVLSTKSVDLPLESMIVDGSYADGKLTLTLQNGTQLEPIDISDLISGLVSQDDFDALETELETSVVHTSGDEDISGTKNFTGVFQIGGATVTYDAETDTFVF